MSTPDIIRVSSDMDILMDYLRHNGKVENQVFCVLETDCWKFAHPEWTLEMKKILRTWLVSP